MAIGSSMMCADPLRGSGSGSGPGSGSGMYLAWVMGPGCEYTGKEFLATSLGGSLGLGSLEQ